MKNLRITLIALIALFYSTSSFSQVTISPVIGISYQPFNVHGSTSYRENVNSSGIDYLFGISAQLPIQKKWFIKMAILYGARESVEWNSCGIIGCTVNEYSHNDLNINLGLNYKISKLIDLGLGFSYIKKLNSSIVSTTWWALPPNDIQVLSVDGFNLGVFVAMTFNLKYFNINIEHMRKASTKQNFTRRAQLTEKSRTNLTIAVPIFSGRHKN